MAARQVRAAAQPLLAFGVIPQGADHLPALAVVRRAKQAARLRSAPNEAGLLATAGLERPDAGRAPFQRPPPHVVLLVSLRLRRIAGGGTLLPTPPPPPLPFHTQIP